MNALPQAVAVIERGIADGSHAGAQLYVSRNGQRVADLAFGEAKLGVPMRTDSIQLWLSSGKPLTAVAIAQLWEKGRLDLDAPVASLVPEFAQAGKTSITIRHLLTHTGGIRTADKCDAGTEWMEILDCVCRTPPEPGTTPGQQAAYHPSGSWYILGEIVQRLDGRPLEQYLQDEVFSRCGMRDCSVAMPISQFRQFGDRMAVVFQTERHPPAAHRKWNTETEAAVCRPGRNARGPIRELGRFYETLLALRRASDPDGPGALLRPETVRQWTRRQRIGVFDDTFQQTIDWGLGFALDSKHYGRERVSYGFGRHASGETFGHGGSQSSIGFADPTFDLVVTWAFNGLPGERRHQVRNHELNTAIYEDLGLSA